MLRSRLHLLMVLMALLVSSVAPVAQRGTTTLSNGRVTAILGDRGLVTLTDTLTGATYRFAEDAFTLTIGGQTFDSGSLPRPSRTASGTRAIYQWNAGGYRVAVTYELAPTWRFLSKQIAIASGPAGEMHVNEVAPVRLRLSDPVSEAHIVRRGRPNLGTGDYGVFLRRDSARSLGVVVQNPFLNSEADRSRASLRYAPDMAWRFSEGPFLSDRTLLLPARLTGRKLPETMLAEWRMGPGDGPPGLDEGEVAAFTDAVRSFLLYRPERPLNLFVGWCVNDYQIDIATPAGRTEYKRIIDRAAELGAEHVLFAPTNSELARREDSLDDWSWENLLWLGLGQKIRKNEWNPRRDPVPDSVQELLDYAKGRGVRLVAYVYPVVPFTQNPAWLVSPPNTPNRQYASLGVRALQDWLIDELVAFREKTGVSGYAFDHTFLGYPGTSRYAQWAGWRRVMEELRRRVPDIVIDGRQAYHLYGPWTWLAGNYPHPTYSDEQPESFVPFPDLRFDRVSANRQRFTAYRFRNYDFAPSEIVPGFITHQTPRNDETGRMPQTPTPGGIMLDAFRTRDWDYLGWRYSLLSSIAVAGWNNVLNMIPARDLDEHRHFSEADRQWFRGWIDWTHANRETLRRTRTILGQPALGRIDGTSAIIGDRGFIFLFNPNARRLAADFSLDETIGLTARGPFVLKELHPAPARLVGKPGAGAWDAGDRVSIPMDGSSALVLELQPAPKATEPLLFNAAGTAAFADDRLRVTGLRGEAGTSVDLLVQIPPGAAVTTLEANGRPIEFSRPQPHAVAATVRFAGAPFRQMQQVGEHDSAFAGGIFRATFAIPQRVFDQLDARRKAWPIPWTPDDYRSTWLAPERLLLFVQFAEPDEQWPVRLSIDGRPIELRKAYTAIRPASRTFVGFYADVSLLIPDREYEVEVDLPQLKPGQFQGLFFENVETEWTDALQ